VIAGGHAPALDKRQEIIILFFSKVKMFASHLRGLANFNALFVNWSVEFD
jgi:hypothetical protein